ncbi:hypothetical protein D9M71_415000 [compost metagenome]
MVREILYRLSVFSPVGGPKESAQKSCRSVSDVIGRIAPGWEVMEMDCVTMPLGDRLLRYRVAILIRLGDEEKLLFDLPILVHCCF